MGESPPIKGIWTLTGKVPATAGGLGKLLSDPRVYLADTAAVDVAAVVKGNPRWQGKEIKSILVFSPPQELVLGY